MSKYYLIPEGELPEMLKGALSHFNCTLIDTDQSIEQRAKELIKNEEFHPIDGVKHYDGETFLESLKAIATQQQAIDQQLMFDFVGWAAIEGWNFNAIKNTWWSLLTAAEPSTAELYQLFLSEKKQEVKVG